MTTPDKNQPDLERFGQTLTSVGHTIDNAVSTIRSEGLHGVRLVTQDAWGTVRRHPFKTAATVLGAAVLFAGVAFEAHGAHHQQQPVMPDKTEDQPQE